MRIGILGKPTSWHVSDLQRAAAVRQDGQWDVVPLPFAAMSADIRARSLSVRTPVGQVNDLQGIVVRTMPTGSLEQIIFRMDLLHSLAERGVPIINPPRALETAIDKYLTLARLQSVGHCVPDTIVTQSSEEALSAFHDLGGDVVVKPIFGSEGRGMVRVTDVEIARRTFHALQTIQAVFYVQRFILNFGSDLRLLTIGDRVLGMRRVCRDHWKANLAQGATAEPLEIDSTLAEQALRAANTIGADMAAVDLLPALDGNLYALEVNAVPGWRGISRVLDIDVAQLVLSHIAAKVSL